MCKPLCIVLASLLLFLSAVISLVFEFTYTIVRFTQPEVHREIYRTTEFLMFLEFLSLFLAGSGLFLNYLKFKVKIIFCFWIITFCLLEAEVLFLIFCETAQKFDAYSIFHFLHICFAIYSLASVYGNFKGLKYCPTNEVQMELGDGNS